MRVEEHYRTAKQMVTVFMQTSKGGWFVRFPTDGDDLLPARGPGAIFLLAVAASWSQRIFFLARARKKTLCKRKKTHKGNPRFSLENPFPTEGPRPLRHPWGSKFAVQYRSSVPRNI